MSEVIRFWLPIYEFFEGFFNVARWHFPTIRLMCLKITDRIFAPILPDLWTRKSQSGFWTSHLTWISLGGGLRSPSAPLYYIVFSISPGCIWRGVRGFDPPQEVTDPQKVLQKLFGGRLSLPQEPPDSIFLLNQYIYVQLYAAYRDRRDLI